MLRRWMKLSAWVGSMARSNQSTPPTTAKSSPDAANAAFGPRSMWGMWQGSKKKAACSPPGSLPSMPRRRTDDGKPPITVPAAPRCPRISSPLYRKNPTHKPSSRPSISRSATASFFESLLPRNRRHEANESLTLSPCFFEVKKGRGQKSCYFAAEVTNGFKAAARSL